MMQRLCVTWRPLTVFFVVLAGLDGPPARGQEGDLPGPVSITPAPDADDRMFLFRVLEGMYGSLPSGVTDSGTWATSSQDLRTRAIRYQQHVRDAQLDPELDQLFTDYVEVLDTYTQFLANIAQIDAGLETQAGVDNFGAGYEGGSTARSVYEGMRANDYGVKGSVAGAAAAGTLHFLINAYQGSRARDEARQQAVATETQRLSDKITACYSRAQNAAGNLTVRYGWQRGEVGFGAGESPAQQVAALAQQGDYDGVVRLMDQTIALRPHDAFARIDRNYYQASNSQTPDQTILTGAADCVSAAALIPASPVFDDYRTYALNVAADLAESVRLREIMAGTDPYGSTAAARYAVALYRAALRYQPTDTTGDQRLGLANALLSNNELDEALNRVVEVWELKGSDPTLYYTTACIMSRKGDGASALTYLRSAIEHGYRNLPHTRRDPDLASLRDGLPTEFADLTEVRWEWNIVYGVFNDDITLTNKSAFPLTNVTFDVTLIQDTKSWDPDLQAAAIQPGETYTWSNVVSIPGSRLTDSTAAVYSDQSEEGTVAPFNFFEGMENLFQFSE